MTVKSTYDEALSKIQAVMFNPNSTDDQRATAKQALDDLTSSMLAHNLKTIEGRTALLSALIVELQEVTNSIQVDSPIAGIATALTGLIDQANTLYRAEKDNLAKEG